MVNENNTDDSPEIIALKVRLYDVIEAQSVLVAENNRLEQIKAELAKQLGETRKAGREAEAA